MKKLLAIFIAVILLAAMTPMAFAASATVYFTASVDGVIDVAAQPITVSELTVDAVLKAAHAQFFEGGESAYVASDDPMYGYFITEAWGVATTPYVVLNNAPLGADSAVPANANQAPVADGDNIVLCTSSDSSSPPSGLTATVSDNTATVTAVSWALDFTTFAYTSTPYANAEVTDPVAGASLGTTDSNGVITLSLPESGVVAVGGLAAIYVGTPEPVAEEPPVEEPPAEEPPVEEPPAEEPPAEEPPVEEPPVAEEPPVEEPPVVEEPEAPSEQHDVLPQTGGVSPSSIIGIIGLCLIFASAIIYAVRKKLTAK